MEVKKIVEGMTAPQVAQVIDDNFKGLNEEKANKVETDAKLSELGSNLITKSSFCVAVNGKESHFLASIVKNNNDITVTFNSNITIFGNINDAPYSYSDLQTRGKSYDIPNVHGLVVDFENGNFEIKDLAANYSLEELAKAKKILICANLRGVLTSPISSFQSEISYLANDKPLDSILFGGFSTYSKHLVIGSINLETGAIDDNNMCVATDGIEVAALGQQIKYSNDIYLMLLICDSQGKPISSTGWLTDGGVYTFDADCYYKLQFALNPMVDIPNIEGVRSKVQFDTKGQYLSKEDVAKSQLSKNFEKVIVVSKSGGDFLSVREAVDSITDASENRRYKVFVRNGTYHEIDIRTKDFVNIEGESKDGVILYTDGHAETISPSDYNFSSDLYSGIPIKDIPKAYKHLFLHISNSKISNLTMLVYYCKYVIHQDGWSHEYDALVENCVIKRSGDYNEDSDAYEKSLQNLVGIGAFGGQFQRYINCEFQQELINIPNEINHEISAVVWHNWNEQLKKSGLTMKDCNIYGCNIANIFELGSGQQDVVELINCVSNNPKFGVIYDRNEIATGQGYYIKVNINGGNIQSVFLTKNRLNGSDKIYNPYTMERVQIDKGSTIGAAIAVKDFGLGKSAIATASTKKFAFSMEEKTADSLCYINCGKIGYGLAVADSYTFGDALYITDGGVFTRVDNGNKIGVCLETATFEKDSLLKIYNTTSIRE